MRIEHHKDCFERVWKMQPRFMAVFGKDAAGIFMKLHKARREIEVSAGMLMRSAATGENYRDIEFRKKLENDIWNVDEKTNEIAPKVKEFVEGVEKHCQPVVAHRYARKSRT